MTVRLLDRAAAPAPTAQLPSRPVGLPDAGYEAVPRLVQLRDQLVAASAARTPGRWKEPPVFFFDARRQAEFEAARQPVTNAPFAELGTAITAELPALFGSVEVRRVARAIDGLRAAAEALAPACPPAKDLAELLAVPDDEVIVVLHPGRRAGFRLAVRGIADVGQFHILAADAMAGEPGFSAGRPVAERFVAACRDVNPTTPAGVPMVAEARFQLYTPAALRTDGTLPPGMGGCGHWLWPAMPLASVPRVGGERIILVGPPAFAMTWDVSRRFPALPAEVRVIETLSPFRVAERLSRIGGSPVAPAMPSQPDEVFSKAA
jgi:hypothetical protein